MKDSNAISVVQFTVAVEAVPLVEEILTAQGLAFAVWRNPEATVSAARVYCGDRDEAEQQQQELAHIFGRIPGLAEQIRDWNVREEKREDWAETWKAYFHAFRASERLVVKPSWEPWQGSDDDIIVELDPGMSFGTGYHGTTRACLGFIDELAHRLGCVSFLDAGCGSGILSLAAWKLGYRPVVGFDHDPQAVQAARENLLAAGIAEPEIHLADLENAQFPQTFRVVAANILAPVLISHADRLLGFLDRLSHPSYLILSGILNAQYAEVKNRFESLGLREIDCRTVDEWTSGCYEAAGAGSSRGV
jgi:ribosomal protein L11 methyltransferase